MSRSGTIRQVVLDKVNYDVAADSDFDRKPPQTIEAQATSGSPNIKATKQNPDVESVDIIADGVDRETILDLAASTESFDMAYVTANGDTYTSKGFINITADGTQDAKISIMMIPENDWTAIVV